MNIARHFEVLKRGRATLALGLLVAIAMAIFATFKVSLDGGAKLTYRKAETWSASTKLLITQPGFPWGRSVLPGSVMTPGVPDSSSSDSGESGVQFADPSRLAYLAWIYSHFLMGDEVRTMIKHKPVGMDIAASPLTAGGNMSAAALPIIGLSTSATTAADAQRLNDDVRSALEDYLRRQQRESDTPTTDRVVVSVVDRPGPVLVKGHSINLGVVAFLLVMAGTVALIYLLENLRIQRQGAEGGLWGDVQEPERIFNGQAELGDARAQTGKRARAERSSAV
jgi:hypothetical protein